jgi:hypothetical protein
MPQAPCRAERERPYGPLKNRLSRHGKGAAPADASAVRSPSQGRTRESA